MLKWQSEIRIFSFLPQKSQLHFDNLGLAYANYSRYAVPKNGHFNDFLSFRFNGNMFSAESDAVFIDHFYTF